jgi:hypothetical protein
VVGHLVNQQIFIKHYVGVWDKAILKADQKLHNFIFRELAFWWQETTNKEN